jgi:hypothetical protein
MRAGKQKIMHENAGLATSIPVTLDDHRAAALFLSTIFQQLHHLLKQSPADIHLAVRVSEQIVFAVKCDCSIADFGSAWEHEQSIAISFCRPKRC